MLGKKVRIQIVLFVTITVVAVGMIVAKYMSIPDRLGLTNYTVTLALPDTGGLYPRADVTYRGSRVGSVGAVSLDKSGNVIATIQINNGVHIPADAQAQVRSMSVIGEQYVDFVPRDESSSTRMLQPSARIPVSQTSIPVTTDTLLTSVDNLVQSVPLDDLSSVVNDADVAFNDTSDNLRNIIKSGSTFEQAAADALPETKALINDSASVLATQKDLSPHLRRFSSSLNQVTSALQHSDTNLRALLKETPEFADQVASYSDTLKTTLPPVLQDTAQVAAPLRVYKSALEDLLIEFPATESMFQATLPASDRNSKEPRVNLYFKLGFNPPSCTHGFPDATKQRSPDDESLAPIPADSYCKVAANSQSVVRGARNGPCPNDPARRAATARGCGLVFDASAVAAQDDAARASDATAGSGSTLSGSVPDVMMRDGVPFLLAGSAPAGDLTTIESAHVK